MSEQEDITEPLTIAVPLGEILEVLRLVSKIQVPEVPYCEDMLLMTQQALRSSLRYAEEAGNILYKWTQCC